MEEEMRLLKQILWCVAIGVIAGLLLFRFSSRTHADQPERLLLPDCPTKAPAWGMSAYINCNGEGL
jgi:hypothetical protein